VIETPIPQVHVSAFTPLVLASLHELPVPVAEQHVRSALIDLAERADVVKRTVYATVGERRCDAVACLTEKDQESLCLDRALEVQYPGCGKLKPVSCINDTQCTANTYYAEMPHMWFSNTAPCDLHVEVVAGCVPRHDACYFDASLLKFTMQVAAYATGLGQNMPSADWYNPSAHLSSKRQWDKFVTERRVDVTRGGMGGPLQPAPRRFV